MTKNVAYKGKVYKVQYEYQQSRDITNSIRENALYLLDKNDLSIYSEKWFDKYEHRESIIEKVKLLIDNYINSITKYNDHDNIHKFESWDGQLDLFDE